MKCLHLILKRIARAIVFLCLVTSFFSTFAFSQCMPTILLDENFESSASNLGDNYYPPSNWDTYGENFLVDDYFAHSGTISIAVSSVETSPNYGNFGLITPQFTPSNGTTFSFWLTTDYFLGNANAYKTIRVKVSTTNTQLESFTTIAEFSTYNYLTDDYGNFIFWGCYQFNLSDIFYNWYKCNVNLSAYAGTPIYLAFEVFCHKGEESFFNFDDFRIETPIAEDLTIIDFAPEFLTINQPTPLTVSIKNQGVNNVAAGAYSVSISEATYNQVVTNTPAINAGNTATITFPNFTATSETNFTFISTVDYLADECPTNNSLSKSVGTNQNSTLTEITPINPNNINVCIGTSEQDLISQLPTTTTILDNLSNSYNVLLDWTIINYDSNIPNTYTAKGTFNLPAGVNNNNSLNLFVTIDVTVVLVPAPTVSLPDTPICNSFLLPISSSSDIWEWKDENNNIVSSATIVGTHTYTVIASEFGCNSNPTSIELTISAPVVEIIQNNNLLTATQGFVSYEWKIETTTLSETTNTLTITENGHYFVYVTDINGCEANDDIVVSGINLKDFSCENIYIYPNPSNGEFTINLGNIENARKYQIIDTKGTIVIEASINNRFQPVNINLVAGNYYIKIITDNNVYIENIILK